MKFDLEAFRPLFLKLLSEPTVVSQAMAIVVDACRSLDPEADWSSLLALPYDEEVESLAKVLNRILQESPPPESVKGLIFGADEFFEGDASHVALQLVSAERIDADDPQFGQSRYDLRYEPPIAIKSDILNELHRFALDLEPEFDGLDLENPSEDLEQLEAGTLADHFLLWSYSALAVAQACESAETHHWLGRVPSRKVYVGHGEDYLRLGLILPEGFRRAPLLD